jgi:hypothetical protein
MNEIKSYYLYPPVQISLFRKIATGLLTLVTLTGYLWFQMYQLQKALKEEQIEKAEEHIQKGGWFAYQFFIKSSDIHSLSTKEKSLQLIASQILFDPKSPNGASQAAHAFIAARDDRSQDRSPPKIIEDLLPYHFLPETILDPKWNGIKESDDRIFLNSKSEEEPNQSVLNSLQQLRSFHKYRSKTAEDFIASVYQKFPYLEKSGSESRHKGQQHRAILRQFYSQEA